MGARLGTFHSSALPWVICPQADSITTSSDLLQGLCIDGAALRHFNLHTRQFVSYNEYTQRDVHTARELLCPCHDCCRDGQQAEVLGRLDHDIPCTSCLSCCLRPSKCPDLHQEQGEPPHLPVYPASAVCSARSLLTNAATIQTTFRQHC